MRKRDRDIVLLLDQRQREEKAKDGRREMNQHCLCREGRANQQINERETDKKRAKERAVERERETERELGAQMRCTHTIELAEGGVISGVRGSWK